ncbi:MULTISPECIES: 50S ribosomal protein L21 [Aequorivita]|jgi:large subunit ribosomal protein L21|uniref:Large ribosomal subunit protein bL21 n=2 Tax=Aequorivita TaxID=153265 RepID=A0A137RFB5_9FLAO|nr:MULTISPECIES: 50S ribosomal protein L21 [Aequorivita]MAB38828.1 50S ribosomal protein L21 [Aequorivita sp.]KJJ37725.1 50S ribosomal protein L21 [Aequorivita vladivostokensis]KXN98175.1 50S ribosomal protein L21 [Aequorivita aquimaris]MAB56595.1 50S ribosomal protein L21 [Aequorivita sp.]MBF31660.1 50S ribosomal protein L21 [Aequorivita sp.]|tara:strand:+ start:109729 stop:110433 length:705 start_codon:yes stop_codon:yes gene_type:complete
MYAIVEIAGQQVKVAKDQKVFVNRLPVEEGKKVSFDNVLLIGDGDNITIGAPAINGAQIGAKVVKHLKGDKVIVFKKKRRKGFRKKNGHRQYLSEIVIESIVASGATPAKKEEAKKAEPKKETKAKAAAPKAKAETKAPAKKAAPKKAAKADDLKKIEGVGPKAAEAMVAAGLDTFAKVAKAKPEAIATILSEASSNLAHLVTDTWPKQAKLAADGKWDELKELQDKLDGGIEK